VPLDEVVNVVLGVIEDVGDGVGLVVGLAPLGDADRDVSCVPVDVGVVDGVATGVPVPLGVPAAVDDVDAVIDPDGDVDGIGLADGAEHAGYAAPPPTLGTPVTDRSPLPSAQKRCHSWDFVRPDEGTGALTTAVPHDPPPLTLLLSTLPTAISSADDNTHPDTPPTTAVLATKDAPAAE